MAAARSFAMGMSSWPPGQDSGGPQKHKWNHAERPVAAVWQQREASRWGCRRGRRDKILEDLRSTNGTTLNARLLPYGSSAKLRDGDVVVAAGTRFWRTSEAQMEPR